jgi:hypothetical protein
VWEENWVQEPKQSLHFQENMTAAGRSHGLALVFNVPTSLIREAKSVGLRQENGHGLGA